MIMRSSFHKKTGAVKKTIQLDKFHDEVSHRESPESPDSAFSGGSFPAAPPPPLNINNPCGIKAPHFSGRLSFNIQEINTTFPLLRNSAPNLENRFPNNNTTSSLDKRDSTELSAMREMMFRAAMMQPIEIGPEAVKPQERKNARISKDPMSVAARRRRERISQRMRILQRMVPGGTKLDTASMLDVAADYLKFLKNEVQSLTQTSKFP